MPQQRTRHWGTSPGQNEVLRETEHEMDESVPCRQPPSMDTTICRKLIVVGDNTCGKRSLLYTFCNEEFPEVFVPTAFDGHTVVVETDGKPVELGLFHTDGQENYDRLRPLNYLGSHVVMICFAIDSPDSLDNAQEKWILEARRFCPGISIILVGCKKDLRHDPKTIDELCKTNQRPITAEEGISIAQKIGAHCYLECSAKTGEGVRDVLHYTARASLWRPCGRRKRRKSGCIIL
ncbi:unnamed protein product [Rhizoctonia solani]|uniref:Uncharacterized protein n=1 Tax=Rhizoctonia solani TaxID=456999 RepID=A0A8H3AEV9_9AGAM|nr:unnamed protein product [Rhizoctonia solani]CAE6417778.1 unnamed protein product [Rhizoctonia solani]